MTDPVDRVTVSGRAMRRVVSDRAAWTVRIVERDSDEKKAYNRCTERVNALLAVLRAEVGDDGRVETGQLRVDRVWDDKRRKEAFGSLAVEVAAARAGTAIAAAMDAGADRIDGPRFSVEGRDAIYDELLADAVGAARVKAERLAAAAGRSLGRAVTIREGEDDDVGIAYGASAVTRSFSPQAAPAAVPATEPPEQEIAAVVTVTYELAG